MVKFTKMNLIVLFGFLCCLAQEASAKYEFDVYEYNSKTMSFDLARAGSLIEKENRDRSTDTYRLLKNNDTEKDMELLVLLGFNQTVQRIINTPQNLDAFKTPLIKHLNGITELAKLKVVFLAGKHFQKFREKATADNISRWMHHHPKDDENRNMEKYIQILPFEEIFNLKYLDFVTKEPLKTTNEKNNQLEKRMNPFIIPPVMTLTIRDITKGVDHSKGKEKQIHVRATKNKYINDNEDYKYIDNSENVEIRWILSQLFHSIYFLRGNKKVTDGIVRKMIEIEEEKNPQKKILVKHVEFDDQSGIEPVALFLQFLVENGPKDRRISQFNEIFGYEDLKGPYYDRSVSPKEKIESFNDPDLRSCFEKDLSSVEVIRFHRDEFVYDDEFLREESITIPIESEHCEDPDHNQQRYIDGPSPDRILVLVYPVWTVDKIFFPPYVKYELLRRLEVFAENAIALTSKGDAEVNKSDIGVQLWGIKNARKLVDIAKTLSIFMRARGRKGPELVKTYITLHCFGPFQKYKYLDKDGDEIKQWQNDSLDEYNKNLESETPGPSPVIHATAIPRPYFESPCRTTPPTLEVSAHKRRRTGGSPGK